MSAEKPLKRDLAFIGYSQRDKRALDQLHTSLELYARDQAIKYWDDTKIPSGAKWKEEIQKALKSAAVAILLVSPDFLASGFIARNELPPLLKAAEEEGVTILSVILRDCLFEDSNLRGFQSVNPPSEPLNGMTQRRRDAVWVKVATVVKQCLEQKQNENKGL